MIFKFFGKDLYILYTSNTEILIIHQKHQNVNLPEEQNTAICIEPHSIPTHCVDPRMSSGPTSGVRRDSRPWLFHSLSHSWAALSSAVCCSSRDAATAPWWESWAVTGRSTSLW